MIKGASSRSAPVQNGNGFYYVMATEPGCPPFCCQRVARFRRFFECASKLRPGSKTNHNPTSSLPPGPTGPSMALGVGWLLGGEAAHLRLGTRPGDSAGGSRLKSTWRWQPDANGRAFVDWAVAPARFFEAEAISPVCAPFSIPLLHQAPASFQLAAAGLKHLGIRRSVGPPLNGGQAMRRSFLAAAHHPRRHQQERRAGRHLAGADSQGWSRSITWRNREHRVDLQGGHSRPLNARRDLRLQSRDFAANSFGNGASEYSSRMAIA